MIIPQAIRIVIPPMGNEFITLLKLTSLALGDLGHELLTAAQNFYVDELQLRGGVHRRVRSTTS